MTSDIRGLGTLTVDEMICNCTGQIWSMCCGTAHDRAGGLGGRARAAICPASASEDIHMSLCLTSLPIEL